MPYESFKCTHHLSIVGLVQDTHTGSWRYLIQVQRRMHDDQDTSLANSSDKNHRHAFAVHSSFRPLPHSTCLISGSYAIRRSFAEFKALHMMMAPLMGKALPPLPVDSLMAFFVGETQTMLQQKRLALENILQAIEAHSAASDSSEYLEFLANTHSYEQYSKAPLSPPMKSYRESSMPTLRTSYHLTAESDGIFDDQPRRRSVDADRFANQQEAKVEFRRFSLI